jgi:2-polyprenyl-6-methoxyphenol hydroxylase-like FAD-dependent oxidoreductase
LQQKGLPAFQQEIAAIAPWLSDRVSELNDWNRIKLLSVQINRLQKWHRPGLLFIGDAAHAMSPAGGVGINLAIQDAVAAANLLARPLREQRLTAADLAQVQKRREFPARAMQRVQTVAHKGMVRIFKNPGPAKAPWQLKAAINFPGTQRLLGRMVGLGFRPEHIELRPDHSL